MRDNGRQHFLDVERRGDGLTDLAECLELVDRAGQLSGAILKLLEEAGILDGDHSLVRKRLHQGDLTIRERPHGDSPQHDRADRKALAE